MLARVAAEEAGRGRGKLRVFFGAAPGVGKTYAMLEAARGARSIDEEMRLWQKAEQAIVDEAPWIFSHHNATALLVKPYVKGVVFTRMDAGPEIQQVDLTNVTIEAVP